MSDDFGLVLSREKMFAKTEYDEGRAFRAKVER